MENILLKAVDAVKEAGKIILGFELNSNEIFIKGTADYVTKVDFSVQEYLMKEVKNILPLYNFISEESNQNQYDFTLPTWILDPVDGTTNLMHGYNHSAISLALFIDQKPSLGIIYDPYRDELFTAEAGKGAYLNGKKIYVSTKDQLEQSLLCFGTSPYNKRKAEKVFTLTKEIYLSCQDVRRSGSAALDIAYVACGRMEAYYEMHLKPWDYAAGMVILEEAGGKITDWTGQAPNLSEPTDILASNGHLHPLVRKFFLK